MTVRIAFTKETVNFTKRGREVGYYAHGFIRRNGRTIGGMVYNAGPEFIFYPNKDGLNYEAAYDRKQEAA